MGALAHAERKLHPGLVGAGEGLEVQPHRDLQCVQLLWVLCFSVPSGALLGRGDSQRAVSFRQNAECSPAALSLQLPVLSTG